MAKIPPSTTIAAKYLLDPFLSKKMSVILYACVGTGGNFQNCRRPCTSRFAYKIKEPVSIVSLFSQSPLLLMFLPQGSGEYKYGNLPLWCMSYDLTAGKIEKDRYLLLTPTYHGAESE
ncbi:MAG: hypothetical protein ACTJLL_03190 [Anaplasma sp.]